MNTKFIGKIGFIIFFAFISFSSYAQIFIEEEHVYGLYPSSASFGDIDGDGDIDLVQGINAVSGSNPLNGNNVWMNDDGNGFYFYEALGTFPTVEIELIDMDNDGDLDIIAGNESNYTNRIWLNDGLGNFSAGQSFGNRDVSSLATADFNEDGYPDIILGVRDIGTDDMLYINNGDGTVSMDTDIPFTSGSKTSDVRTTDINNDGHMDFVLSKANTNLAILEESEVWTGFGDGTFYKSPQIFPLVDSGSTVAGDYNGDGFIDLVFLEEGNVNGYLNNGTALFQHSTVLYSEPGVMDIDLLDADVDGDLDLLVARLGGNDNYESEILFNNGTGEFTDGSEQISIASTVKIEVYDIEGDRDLDLFTVNRNDEDCVFWINQTDPPLSINDQDSTRIIIYPNPAQDILNIVSQDQIEIIKIYSILGNLVQESTSTTINISQLQSGVYVIQLSLTEQTIIKKFVIR